MGPHSYLLIASTVVGICAAVPFNSTGNTSSIETVWVTEVVTSTGLSTAVAVVEPSSFVTSLLLSPPAPPSPALPVSSLSPSPAPSVFTEILTNTVTATLTEPPATITVSAPPQTVTDVVTMSPLPPALVPQTAWSAPSQMTDLAAFNVTNFASGQKNLHIFDVIPVDTTVVTLAAMANAVVGNLSSVNAAPAQSNSTAVMQLFYPANSINPANEPQGGADFYATPLDLHDAQNVSLEYSIFFPADFDWVQGGKLPGIYGGHTGCSGGDAAVTCFSTRLMWRAGGAGELYLYAPKDKQTAALCSTPPQSVCDAAYGLSIGRGSFNFTAGGWTRIRQTVALNTPGQQDGGFVLEVNGLPVINRSDVYYRDAPAPSVNPSSGDGDDDGDGDGDASDDDSDDSDDDSDDDGDSDDGDSDGSLGDILGNLLARVALWPERGVLVLRDAIQDSQSTLLPSPTALAQLQVTDAAASAVLAGFMPTSQANVTVVPEMSLVRSTSTVQAALITEVVTPTATMTTVVYPSATPNDIMFAIEDVEEASQPVRFTGLFFSTFFGGHEPEFATPKDQYAWFKDFSMTINN